MAKYSQLFSINFRHEYFSEAGYLKMNCTPTARTRQLLHNMNVILRLDDGAYKLFYDAELYVNSQELYSLFSDEAMTFIFYPDDSQNFYNYTDGINISDDGVMLFTADDAKQKNGIVDTGYAEFVKFKTSSKKPKAADAEHAPQLTNAELFEVDEIAEFRSTNKSCTPVVFKINTDILLAFPVSCQFLLNFSSLKTYFKYYLCHDFDSKQLKLIDVNKKINFSRSQDEQINNGKLAEVFISTSPVTSLYKKKRHFQLVDGSSGSSRVYMDNMPLPRPGNYYKEQIDGHTVIVSEVFIN